jgi:serine/threonine-protein kinase HipA
MTAWSTHAGSLSGCMMSAAMCAGLSKQFAFNIGGEYMPRKMRQEHVRAMAEQSGFKPKYVLSIAARPDENLISSIETVSDELSAVVSHGTEKTMLARLQQAVNDNTKKPLRRFT